MTVRGWCPGLHDPMPSGDGWLVRVRPPLARLTTAQAVALDRLASSCGNGIIEITARGNLQVRGLGPATHRGFVDGICDAGLGQRDPVLERRRRVIVAPFADQTLVAELEAALMATDAIDRLPPKFVFRVDGDPVSVTGVPAEVALVRECGRIRITAGEVSFLGTVEDAVGCLASRPRPKPRGAGPIGRLRGIDAVAVAPKFGQFGPGELAALAERAGTVLRITPFRSVVVCGVPDDFARGLAVITDPEDRRLRIVTCVGAPRCASGLGPARAVAEDYVGMVPTSGVLHVSGCAKGCAHRGEALFFVPGSGASPGGVRERSPWP